MAIGFNASGDYAKRTGSPAFSMTGNTDKFTMAGWIKIRDITPGAYSFPLGVEDADSSSSRWSLLGYTDTSVFCFSTTVDGPIFIAQPSQDTWYYLYITGENNGSGYIDFHGGYYTAAGGSPVEVENPTLQAEFDVARICIGNDSWDEWLDCMLAHVRVWTGVVLSDSELRTERDSATAVKTTGLWADWPLADNTDTGDDSGNGRTLTFGGTLTSETSPTFSGGDTELAPANATHAQTAGAPALTQAHTLVVAATAHAHTAANVTLGAAVSLTVADASHAHTAAAPVLTQAHGLAVAAAEHAHTAANVTLATPTLLVIQNGLHLLTSGNPALTQLHNLLAANAAHAHTAEGAVLTQAHTLATADAAHAHTADAPALTQAHGLAAANAAHVHTADGVALAQAHALSVGDVAHAHTADAPALTQVHSLVTADVAHAHTADNVVLGSSDTLIVANAAYAHNADGVDLTQLHNVLVAGVQHAHTAAAPVLTQAHSLAVASALHAHSADSPTVHSGATTFQAAWVARANRFFGGGAYRV